jgi:hypothetical protein
MKSLDRVLSESDSPSPSTAFHASVMDAIRQGERSAPLAFPWRWLVAAGSAAAAVSFGAAVAPADLVRWAADPAAVWSGIAVLASALAAWVSVELAEV